MNGLGRGTFMVKKYWFLIPMNNLGRERETEIEAEPERPDADHYFWCWTYVKWGFLNFHPLKGFVSTIIRSACRSQNVVLFLTRSQKEQFFPLFSPLIAIPYKLEICPLSMLNGGVSIFTPWKDSFLQSSVWPVGPKTWCSFWLRVKKSNFSPYFPLSSPYPMS